MSKLQIEFLDGKILELEIDECGDQIGLFTWRGDAAQARQRGYVAARNGVSLALNGEPGKDVDIYPLASIRRMKELR